MVSWRTLTSFRDTALNKLPKDTANILKEQREKGALYVC